MNSIGLKLLEEMQKNPEAFMGDIQERGVKIGRLFGMWGSKVDDEESVKTIIALVLFAAFMADYLGMPQEMLSILLMSLEKFGLKTPFEKVH